MAESVENQCKKPDKVPLSLKLKMKKNKLSHRIDLFLDIFRRNVPFKYREGDKVFVNNPDDPFVEIVSKRKVRPHMNRYKCKSPNGSFPGSDIPESHILSVVNFGKTKNR